MTNLKSLTFVALIFLAGCFPTVVGAPCTVDTNCPTGQSCVAGRCALGDGTAGDAGTGGGSVSGTGGGKATGGGSGTGGGSASGGGSGTGGSSGTGGGTAGEVTLVLNTSTYDFGSVLTGMTSTAVTFIVTNTGTAPASSVTVAFSGTNASFFNTSNCPSLGAGASCSIAVTFTPTTAGAASASLDVSAPGATTIHAALSGMGVTAGALTISPMNANLGSTLEGTDGGSTSFTVTNSGGVSSGALVAPTLSGSGAADFSIQNDGCGTTALAPAGTCTVLVRFLPATPGTKQAALTVGSAGAGTAVASLTATSLAKAQLSLSPTAQNFGSIVTGNSAIASFTVTNTGAVATSAITASIVGTTDFTSTNTCTAPLNPGTSCTVSVTFAPASVGAKNASLQVTAATGGSAQASLSGTGIAPGTLSISPLNQSYGGVLVSAFSSSKTFTITNTGGAATGLPMVNLGGTAPDQYGITGNTCTSAIAAGGTCTVSVRFGPTSTGAKSAYIQVVANPGGTVQANLDGTGQAAAKLGLSPPGATYPDTLITKQSTSQSFTITNGGDVDSNIITTTLTGPYGIETDSCNGSPLAAHTSCSIRVFFAPSVEGAANGTLSVDAGATGGGSASASLTGTGLSPALLSWSDVSHDFGTVTVAAPAATYTFKLSNSGTQPSSTPTISLASTTVGFTIQSSTCNAPVVKGTPCTVTVAFAPGSYGAKSTKLSANATTGGTPSTDLSGVGRDLLTLTLTISGNSSNNSAVKAGGSVSSSPAGISCTNGTGTCSFDFERTTANPTITLTAVPTATTTQATVNSWVNCTSSSGNSCTVTMSGPTSITAKFALTTFNWVVTPVLKGDATGTVATNGTSCGANCSTFNYGDTANLNVNVTANSNPGYTFSGWVAGPCAGTNTNPCSLASVTSAFASISAVISPFNYMFVTSTTYTAGLLGTFDPLGGNDGFRGGDAICQARAAASSNPSLKNTAKTYKAWLASAASGTDALNRLTTTLTPRGWVRPDGVPFADTIKLPNGFDTFYSFPMLDENGTAISSPYVGMTSANGNGSPEPGNTACANWSSTSTAGNANTLGGDPGNGPQLWSRSLGLACNAVGRLYCFGVDYASPIKVPAPTGTIHRVFIAGNGYQVKPGGSIADADAACRTEAVNAGVCSSVSTCTVLAVLASSGVAAASRGWANLGAPVYRLDNVKVATTLSNFFSGFLLSTPEIMADGRTSGGFYHFTGASTPNTAGTPATTCSNWSDTAGSSIGSQISNVQMRSVGGQSTTWFGNLGNIGCTATQKILCLEP